MEPVINLDFTVEELNLILKGLGELPAKDSMHMIAKIQQEAGKQLNPPNNEGAE